MELNRYIDHTLLKADANEADIKTLCEEAIQYEFKSVCINPTWVEVCTNILKDSEVLVCTVIGFPLGANHTDIKVFEAKKAVADGADEIDMVINIGWVKNQWFDKVRREIDLILDAIPDNIIVKVIIETALLTEEEIRKVSQIVKESKADFVKTSTGFSTRGASLNDIKIIKEIIGNSKLIKASGGIRNFDETIQMIRLGSDRIGASRGIDIMEESKNR
ncbi:deoxyribose-phosphate aldolase [Facklamia sp. DSM 111018]|uniref:Deoxyribose-phosphate aldolase n=1 Tax=Facklamia lactis TaxID=2749967 RepID=A0ABS0LQC6_9LACT|nr:deoxyribose-phosphate aldolase [Facklamia lactis]MBG9986362.1 deoxyribose-phosphate aldolase [Facklamia lactis]